MTKAIVNNGWRLMKKGDLASIGQMAQICHPDLPEETIVLQEKHQLAPQTCFVLQTGKSISGYAFAHPYILGCVPALNRQFNAIPQKSDTLYLHDIAIMPQARGVGAAAAIVTNFKAYAKHNNYKTLSLVAVNGTVPFWQKQGFEVKKTPLLVQKKLATYGDDACYMVLDSGA